LLAAFKAMPMDKIVGRAKDYITPKDIPQKQEVMNWLDERKNEADQNPELADENKRAIFIKIQDIGGYRGIRYILRG
jgi:hypothetical protein